MNDFQETLNDLASKGTDADQAEVKVQLRKLGSLYDDMTAKVQVFGSENKDKRIANETLAKENRELKAQNATLEEQVKSADNSPLKDELADLKKQQTTWVDSAKSALIKKLEGMKEHSKWDKVKELLSINQDDDGKFDLSELDHSGVTTLQSRINEFESLGLLDGAPEPESKPDLFNEVKGRVQPNGVNNPPDDMSDKSKVSDFVSKELQKNLTL
ncbi:MAG: hypothetical protein CMB80_12480 [Flammeovirgaceae bacterium]|nr:hypothetical protein [Flammeovirgaceae bacterium]